MYLNFTDQDAWLVSETISFTRFEYVKVISIFTPEFLINYGTKKAILFIH